MRRYAFEAFIFHFVWSVFLFGFTDGFAMPFTSWLEGFYQWDAKWYGSMALDGYGFMPHTFVFPPVHGWVLGRLTDVAVFFAGLIQDKPVWPHYFFKVSLVFGLLCFAIGNTILVWLAERRWQIARRRLWLTTLANPVGYFAFTAYSDMFFFALFTATLALALWTSPRHHLWGLPSLSDHLHTRLRLALALLIGLAPWVRLTGIAFTIWIFLKRKEALAAVVSFIGFLGYNWYRTGDPFFFLLGQKAFMMPDGGFLKGLKTSAAIVYSFFDGTAYLGGEFLLYAFNFGFLTIVALLLSVALIVWLYKKKEYELALVVLAIVAVSHNQAFWRSTVRYALPLYPCFFWMLCASPHRDETESPPELSLGLRIATGVFVGFGFTLQVFYARLFHVGAWAF